MSNALVLHNSLNIGKVKVDNSRNIDKIGDSLYGLLEDFISFLERVRHCCTPVYDLKKLVIRNHNKCIYIRLDILDTKHSILHTHTCLKAERLCNNAYGKNPHFSGKFCNNGSCTCSGSATHTTGNEYHISTLERCRNLFCALLCRFLTNLRLSTCSKTLCKLFTNL